MFGGWFRGSPSQNCTPPPPEAHLWGARRKGGGMSNVEFCKVAPLGVVAEFFNLFNHPNVSHINPVFGSNAGPTISFGLPLEGTGARPIQFSLDYEF